VNRKPVIDATKKLPGEGLKRPWPRLIKMDEFPSFSPRHASEQFSEQKTRN
jgi:3-polyprenyl-4-hydroxybenzoate decarboxylase